MNKKRKIIYDVNIVFKETNLEELKPVLDIIEKNGGYQMTLHNWKLITCKKSQKGKNKNDS